MKGDWKEFLADPERDQVRLVRWLLIAALLAALFIGYEASQHNPYNLDRPVDGTDEPTESAPYS